MTGIPGPAVADRELAELDAVALDHALHRLQQRITALQAAAADRPRPITVLPLHQAPLA
ncbi:hypothetical protein GCM10010406_21650 [Streptomyces thermolineatus]|uniref:Uncharacterized protein n=1 Tax=Streptomyces thermolineatus TaxID=44033 RepID=A0ABP5YV21_9ACTN